MHPHNSEKDKHVDEKGAHIGESREGLDQSLN
jgi:hypothetical protein